MNDDQTLVCPNSECNENRYTDNTTVPRAQMSCKSIGMALTQMLLNDETRQLFEYKSNFNYSDTQLTDIFSGKNYQHLRNNNIIGDNDICIVMYVDGFQNKHKPDHSQTMVHSIVMNLDPSVR